VHVCNRNAKNESEFNNENVLPKIDASTSKAFKNSGCLFWSCTIEAYRYRYMSME
jgi:hypothetical protein